MRKFAILFCLILSVSSAVSADAVMAESRALAKRATMYQIPMTEVKTHFETILKTRALNENEKSLQKLIAVADVLKVATISTYNKDLSNLYPQSITQSMVNKMHEHPKWDAPLSADDLKKLTPDLSMLQNALGAKSYGWAWFLKQTGKTNEASKMLIDLYEENTKNILSLSSIHSDGSSVLSEVQFIQTALEPMVDMREKALMDAKMQKMKKHVSNLPNAMMMT